MRGMNYRGGDNKTHGQLEQAVRIDSFGLALTETWDSLWWESLEIPVYHARDCCVLMPGRKGEQDITLSRKVNGYGGNQTFFLCPVCGARVRFLYFTGKDRLFKCRKCSRLNYRRQQRTEDPLDHYRDGLKFAREKLGWEPPDWLVPMDFPHVTPDRPRRMREATYQRHLAQFRKYQAAYQRDSLREIRAILGQ